MTDSRKTQTLRHYSTTCYICGGKGVLPRDHNILSRRPGEPMLSSGIQKGRGCPPLSVEEWREIGEQFERCITSTDSLIAALSGRVPASLIDEGIRYRMDLLKSQMKLEPAADRHLGFGSWGVLYPKGKSGE